MLDEAAASGSLVGMRDILVRWRIIAYAEQRDQGQYFRVLAAAARTQATGQAPPGSVSGEEILALINKRLGITR